jgi:LuxR family maltose regulon positive regulatory protein
MDRLLAFPRAKLHPPRSHADTLSRARLNSRVQRALARARLVLVSAPAGSGKTTLLADALGSTAALVAWLRLDGDDNDAMRFVQALVATVARVAPASAVRAAGLLAANAAGVAGEVGLSPRYLLVTLLNDLPLDGPPLAIVLDDLHAVQAPEVYALLDELLEQLPAGATLLATTRSDPPLALPRLRARRELLEIRLPELRFHPNEAQQLLNERLALALPEPAVATLHARTEGWAAGLALFAASLEQLPDRAARQQLVHTVHLTERTIFDFLAEEVLARQEPFVRMFLLETAVLPDLSPAGCTALTGREDAATILDDLARRNLFLVALDGDAMQPGGAFYRYHDLFRAFLLERLKRDHPQWLARLHCRAAAVEPDPARRIGHLLAAEAWPAAAQAIDQAAPALIAQGAHDLLRSWISALPQPERDTSPRLVFWLGVCAMQAFALAEARVRFEQALAGFASLRDVSGEGTSLVRLATVLTQLGDWQAAQIAITRAEQHALPPEERIALTSVVALQALAAGRWPESLAHFDAMIEVVEATESARPAAQVVVLISGVFSTLPGSLPRMARLERALERRVRDDRDRLALFELRLHQLPWLGAWDAARALFAELLILADRLGARPWVLLRTATIAAYDAMLRGDQRDAERLLAEVLAALAANPAASGLLDPLYHCWRGYVRWCFDDRTGLRADYERVVALEQRYGVHPYTVVVQPLMRALLALAEGSDDDAHRALDAVLGIQERLRYTSILADACVLRAFLHHRRGEFAQARAALMPALDHARAEGAPGYLIWHGPRVLPLLALADADPFAVRARQLLTALVPAPALDVVPELIATGEQLTEREVEVLRILATGASNAVIAERLMISPHTAKRHVANLLAKLGASTRTEAARRAYELDLL